jgi:putative PEP-CTERM system histidine kinase
LTDELFYNPAAWSYGLASLAFAGFAVRLTIAWRGGLRATVLLSTVLLGTLWAGLTFAALAKPAASSIWQAARVFDGLHVAGWLGFLLLLLDDYSDARTDRPWSTTPRWLLLLLAALLAGSALLPLAPPWRDPFPGERELGAFACTLIVSVLGLALCEQLYRRTPLHGRWHVKPLVLGLGAMFAFDLFSASDAALFRMLDRDLWAAEGIAHALVIPFIAMATVRNTAWTIDLHVSRGVVMHSGAMLASGIYLLLAAAAGYYVRFFGGSWGETLQVAVLFAALLGLLALAFSGSLRARLRVFVAKNFFSYRYDYREEWLRFTRELSTPEADAPLPERVVRALAAPVESRGGAIWLERDGAFCEAGRIAFPESRAEEPVSGSLATFLRRTGWVVRVDEYRRAPERYPGLALAEWTKDAWLIVPLTSGAELIGFVALARPRTPNDVDWEVLDLLKTGSRQAASYLAHARAHTALLESQKFDAFNRMSAFVVHDLKNLVAQMSLLLKNAERHRANPEFQKDMLDTVAHVVERMNGLMLQLRSGTTPTEKPRAVDLAEVMARIAAAKPDPRAVFELEGARGVRALGHEDRLERVLGHLVQNALDATPTETGRVCVRAFPDAAFAVVEVADNGVGMTPEFLREKLFRPFQTTKPQGMGIGVYESFQYINAIGGRLQVESASNAGTTFRVLLPQGDLSVPGGEGLRRVA